MYRTLSSTALIIAAFGAASAAPLPPPPSEVYTAPVASECSAETLSVYFPAGTSALTPASRAILEAAQKRLEGCILGPLSLDASAADAHSDLDAKRLAAARIETVSAALQDYQLEGMRVSTRFEVDEQAQSVWTPMDRKVEIRVAAWAPEIG